MNGVFEVSVKATALREIGEKKTPAISFQFTIEKNAINEADTSNNGKTLYYDGFLTEKAFERTMKSIDECFDFDGTDLCAFDKGILDGRKVKATVAEETNDTDGKVYNKVKWINPLESVAGGLKKDPIAAKSVAEKLKVKMLSYRQSNPAKKPTGNTGGF